MAVVIIPARMSATRLPGKPLELLGEWPLVVCVARQAQKAIKRVIVATDSEAIRTACQAHNIEAQMTRPDHASGTDRVAEISERLSDPHVINVQGDEPFLDPRDLKTIAETLETGAPLVSLKTPIVDADEFLSSDAVKVVCNDQKQALYFSQAPIPHGTIFEGAYRHIGVYGYGEKALRQWTQAPMHGLERCERLEQLRALAMGIPITMIDAHSTGRGIDTPADLAWARERIDRLGKAAFP